MFAGCNADWWNYLPHRFPNFARAYVEENVRLEPSSIYRPSSEELPQSRSLDLWNWQTVATEWKGQALGFYGRACSRGFDVAFSFWSILVNGNLLLLMAGVPSLSMALSGLWDMRLKDHSVLTLWIKSCLWMQILGGCSLPVNIMWLPGMVSLR